MAWQLLLNEPSCLLTREIWCEYQYQVTHGILLLFYVFYFSPFVLRFENLIMIFFFCVIKNIACYYCHHPNVNFFVLWMKQIMISAMCLMQLFIINNLCYIQPGLCYFCLSYFVCLWCVHPFLPSYTLVLVRFFILNLLNANFMGALIQISLQN